IEAIVVFSWRGGDEQCQSDLVADSFWRSSWLRAAPAACLRRVALGCPRAYIPRAFRAHASGERVGAEAACKANRRNQLKFKSRGLSRVTVTQHGQLDVFGGEIRGNLEGYGASQTNVTDTQVGGLVFAANAATTLGGTMHVANQVIASAAGRLSITGGQID